MNTADGIRWTPTATVEKYSPIQVDYVRDRSGLAVPDGDTLRRFAAPYETIKVDDNLLTTAGLNRITSVLIGTSTGTLDATRVRLGVGDSSTAAAVGDTTLGSSQYFRVMDATYPQQANGVITFKASYGDSDANFAWNCWGVDLGTATVTSGSSVNTPLVNRKVSSLGTKSTGTWVLTVTITFS